MFNYEIKEDLAPLRSAVGNCRRQYYVKGNEHRMYGPARIAWNARYWREEWFVHDKRHRGDGPAVTVWERNGIILWVQYWRHGMIHNIAGPAYQEWNYRGKLVRETWYLNGKRHREDGPAEIAYDEFNYYLYGIKITDLIKEWAIATGIKDIMAMTPEELTVFKLTWRS